MQQQRKSKSKRKRRRTGSRQTVHVESPSRCSHGDAQATHLPTGKREGAVVCARRRSNTKLTPCHSPSSPNASKYRWIPPCKWHTSRATPRLRRNADAFSHRTPPVQYMRTRLPLSSSSWSSIHPGKSAKESVRGSTLLVNLN